MPMTPVCFCKDGGPAVKMRCLKNGVTLMYKSYTEAVYKKAFASDAWVCPACNTVVAIPGTAVKETEHLIDKVPEGSVIVASNEEEIDELKETYEVPPWIGDRHD